MHNFSIQSFAKLRGCSGPKYFFFHQVPRVSIKNKHQRPNNELWPTLVHLKGYTFDWFSTFAVQTLSLTGERWCKPDETIGPGRLAVRLGSGLRHSCGIRDAARLGNTVANVNAEGAREACDEVD